MLSHVFHYAACAISRINLDEGMRPVVGYMIAPLIGTLIAAAVPWISIGFF
jgi:fructose-specific phosphotransferase system IIC component